VSVAPGTRRPRDDPTTLWVEIPSQTVTWTRDETSPGVASDRPDRVSHLDLHAQVAFQTRRGVAVRYAWVVSLTYMRTCALLRRRMSTTRGETSRCFLCGALGADTREHIIPRCFFENRQTPPNNEWILPSHLACNSATTKDEEYVSMTFATSRPPGVTTNQERFERTKRALGRTEAAGLRERFMGALQPLPSGGAVQKLETGRLERVLAKICKGILYKGAGRFIDAGTGWSVRTATLENIVTWEADEGLPELVDVQGVMSGRWFYETSSNVAGWMLSFYGSHTFCIIAANPDTPGVFDETPDFFPWTPPVVAPPMR